MDIVIPADGQKTVIGALNGYALGANASGQIPSDPVPDGFFRVLPAGGFDRDIVTTVPTIIIESFDIDEDTASTRLGTAIGHLQADGRGGMLGGVVCYGVRLISMPSSLPMPSLPTHHRYTVTISAALRGSVA